jgi:aryl-alcohol dehydrogenase-like predicted oxidoreductase
MQLRQLGHTDLHIAPLVFGGNVFGWTADKATSFDLLDRLAAAGLNAIDTADIYSNWVPGHRGGESETIIGEWLKSSGKRSSTIIVTKVGGGANRQMNGLAAGYIATACDASLKRLGVETIDLYLSHFPDPDTPYEETLGAFEKLKKAGKIRWFGASNLDAGQLRASLDAAKAAGLPRYEVLQPEYNLYDLARFDGPLRDLCVAERIGVITYFSLAKGFLSGKYRSEADLNQSQRGGGVKSYLNPRGFAILDALDKIAALRDAKPAEVALAWTMRRKGVTAPIASATNLQQAESLIKAATLTLTEMDMDMLDAVSGAD